MMDLYEAFCERFAEESTCIRALFLWRWPKGFICTRCGCNEAYQISTRSLPLYECRRCGTQTSLIAGTLLKRTRTPIRLWLYAIFLHAQPDGVNAVQLSHLIGVTYKTAWLMCHKIRNAMSRSESETLLTGLVRVTDSRMFPRATGSSQWHEQEQSVLAGSSEDKQGEILHIKIKKQDKRALRHKYETPSAARFIAENVDRKSAANVVVTRWLGGKRNHVLCRLVRQAESKLAKMFRGIGPKHLQVYLDQYCFIWNRRLQPIFEELMRICATTRPITYRELVGSVAAVDRVLLAAA